jgi:hypothetical protein
VTAGESPDAVLNNLTFAILWLERWQHAVRRGTIAGLRLAIPKQGLRALAHRIKALHPQLAVDLYTRDPVQDMLERVDPNSAGDLGTWLVP